MYYSLTQGGLGIDKGIATGIMGAYGGAVYLFTIIGAWIADRLIGADRTLFGSAIVVMLGHIALALIPGVAGVGVGPASRRTRTAPRAPPRTVSTARTVARRRCVRDGLRGPRGWYVTWRQVCPRAAGRAESSNTPHLFGGFPRRRDGTDDTGLCGPHGVPATVGRGV